MLDWKDAEDSKIQEAMGNIASWKGRKLKIGEYFQDFEGMVTTWEPSQLLTLGSDFKILQLEVKDFDTDFSNAIDSIKKQDVDRNLGSLEKAPTSLMDYPPFAGLDSQCYLKWEEKMIHALLVNRVPAVDQVAKIRKVLSGHPLNMVPESVKTAKAAFSTLRSRYGDEERVLALRVKELKKTGPKPEKPKDQVVWLTDLIGKLQRILELGDQDDDLARVAFSGEIFYTTFNLFPNKDMLKLAKYSEVF